MMAIFLVDAWIFSLFSVLEYYELVICILNWADAVVWLLLER